MRLGPISSFAGALALAAAIAVPAAAQSPNPGGAAAPSSTPPSSSSGTTGPAGAPSLLQYTVPGTVAKILPNGYAAAPASAPLQVQQAIWAANRIVGMPYVYGGGHRAFMASGYDCSGTVSFALHGGGLLKSPMDSSDLERWGVAGHGQWISVYANAGHAYMNIAGIRLDTSAADDPSGASGPRWRPLRHSNAGYRVRRMALL